MEKADAMDEKSIKVVGPYNVGKTIGSGSTGKVKLGTHSMDGSKVAIKMLRKDSVNLKPSMRKKVEREIAILKLIDHPHVLKLVDVYETDLFLFIILEHVEGGELFDYLVSKSKLPLHEALHFFQQIIMGLEYCQSLMICHRDLKPENLLLDLRGNIKIADFGMASLNPKGSLLQTSCGSPHYASPQVVQGIKYNGMQSDIWSCGVILYALVFGKLPFDDSNIKRLLAKVKSGVFHIPEDTEPFVRDLITRMIVVDPDQRITIDEIKRHPWFTSNNNKLAIAPQLDKALIATSLKLDTLNCEILADLQSLGWGTEDEIFSRLVCQELTPEKIYYHLLERKRKERPISASSALNRRALATSVIEGRMRSVSESHTQGSRGARVAAEANLSVAPTPPEDAPSKFKSWFRNPFLRINTKSDSPPSRSGTLSQEVDYDSPPSTVSPVSKTRDLEDVTSDPTARMLRKKLFPELSSSPMSASSPKGSWGSHQFEACRTPGERSASSSSSPLYSNGSPCLTPTRKISMTRTSGFLVNKGLQETLEAIKQLLQEVDVSFQAQEDCSLLCKWTKDEGTVFCII
eukprot:TRINITY_DN5214_c0_g1_i3.p1 TRINITY_DN5214_c0_g1~~TRINITY_DN5214_c0_g1_i3.p1  ORF type:complete len:575 (-),score=118.31 TRINITY_DN5214_c0_g1_i3:77-1801(-)